MLNFYLLGIARSGTTVMADVLNCHDNLFCSKERFGVRRAPNAINFPASYLDVTIDPKRSKFIERMLPEIEKKKNNKILCHGDKQPRKIFKLQDLFKVENTLLIYRQAKEVIPSWNKRANQQKDKGWAANNIGLFFFIDFYLYILGVSQLKNLIVTDYTELFYGDANFELGLIFKKLNVGCNRFNKAIFRRKYYNNKTVKSKKRSLSNKENALITIMQINEFENALHEKKSIEGRNKVIQAYARSLKSNSREIFQYIVGKILELDNEIYIDRLRIVGRQIKRHFGYQDYATIFSDTLDWYQEKNRFIRILKNGFIKAQREI